MILAATWDAERLGPAGRELLGAAARLGAALGADVALASLGGPGAAEEAGGFGAALAFVVEGDHAASGNEGALAAVA
jgi:hypothetical protein